MHVLPGKLVAGSYCKVCLVDEMTLVDNDRRPHDFVNSTLDRGVYSDAVSVRLRYSMYVYRVFVGCILDYRCV